ncbi:cytochrome ubiquinol oxidase subunit I [Actinocrispum sp. NPDC049592]|uniref:cytochrome ubiquinol oxidase subunit I n=1 Tax=Actinocrispum sp. NPDC049592 TaxID=3154835 RepID=UPI003420B863
MGTVTLGRLQFATTTSLHFLFVLLTLGLVTLVAVSQTRAHFSRNPVHLRMTRFWGHIYVINYVLGIATGIVMEFQFGLNWTGLTAFAGDVFGAPLAIETLVAFFLESTFLGLWIFGWGRLPRGLHLALIWLVTATAYASALWVMVANSFLQNPVGYTVSDGTAHLTSLSALMSNPALWTALGHLLSAALLAGGVLVAGISAYHFLKRTKEIEFFRRSLRLGLVAATVGATMVIGLGFSQFDVLRRVQPAKLGSDAERAAAQAIGEARFGPGDYLPPKGIGTFLEVMMNLGFLLYLIVAVALVLCFRSWIERWRIPMYVLVGTIPLPFIAALCGWYFREMGRQPWVVNGLLKTSDAVSDVSPGTMLGSFIAFTAVLIGLAVTNWVLIARVARRGPQPDTLEALPPVPAMSL